MKIAAIVIMLLSFIYGAFEMNNVSKIVKEESVKTLSRDKIHRIIGHIKKYWKVVMILLALIICFALILLSVSINKENTSDNIACISAISYSIISAVIVFFQKKKCIEKIEKEKVN